MAKEKLKPCPFCGAHPVHGLMKAERCQLHGEQFQRARVNCPQGHAEIIGSSLEEAKAGWNKRLADDALSEADKREADARSKALEEAAELCEAEYDKRIGSDYPADRKHDFIVVARSIQSAIRALQLEKQ